jgi:hypothetical protein
MMQYSREKKNIKNPFYIYDIFSGVGKFYYKSKPNCLRGKETYSAVQYYTLFYHNFA